MGLKIIDRIYNNSFTDEPTDWLLGNTGEWQKLNLKLKISAQSDLSSQNTIQFEYPNKIKSTSNTQWNREGFDVGDSIIINFDVLLNDLYFTTFTSNPLEIIEILDTEMILDSDGSDFPVGSNTLPSQFTETNGDSIRWENARIYTDKRPEGIEVLLNHLENSEIDALKLESFIDGSLTKFRSINLGTMAEGVWEDMEAIGNQSGMSVDNYRIRYLGSGTAGGSFGDYVLQNPYSGILTTKIYSTGLTFTSYQNFESESIPINVSNNLDSSVQSQQRNIIGMTNPFVIGTVQYQNANENQCFINNSLTSYNTDVEINFSMRLDSTNDNSVSDEIRLVLMEFSGSGSTKNYVTKTIINSWSNADSLVGQVLNFNGDFNLNVQSGRSYAICLEYYHLAQTLPRSIEYTVFNSNINLKDPNNTGTSIQDTEDHEYLYEVEFYYMISSIFEDISNFEDPITPPSYVFDAKSLTDNFKIIAFPEVNNPNISIENDMNNTKQLGNTGWFDENFNGLENDFNVESVQYFDLSGNPIDQIDHTQPTKVRIEVSGVPNITNQTECGFGFSWVPINEEDYKYKELPFHKNIFVSSGGNFPSFHVGSTYPFSYNGFGYDNIQMRSENPKFIESSGNIIFECVFRPTIEFTSFFDSKDINNRNYIVWLSLADQSLVTNLSDRVSLLCAFNQMEQTIPPAGIYENIENVFFEHGEDPSFPGVFEYNGFIEDDILCQLPFRIDISQNLTFRKMTFGVQARKTTTGETYTLQTYPVDLLSFPTDSNNVQQFDFDSIRGFKLVEGNNKNWVKIERDELGDVGSSKKYNAYYALKIRWEDWLSRAGVPSDFFDSTQLNNGFNNDWFHYINTTDYEIDFFVLIDVNRNGLLQQHKNVWKFNFLDYDSNILIDKEMRSYKQSDNTETTQFPVDGFPELVILNEMTRIEIDFTRNDGSTWDITQSYSVVTLEIYKGSGQFEQRQLSSVWLSEPDNPLKPISGQDKLFLSLHNSDETLRATCLVDPSFLEDVSRYKITGRVGCFDGGFSPNGGLYEPLYESLYE